MNEAKDFRCTHKLDKLVGRDELLGKIRCKINHSQGAQLIFLMGEGGAGKTRILEELLKTKFSWLLQKNPNAPKEENQNIIDFYDIQNHSASAMAKNIFEALGEPKEFAQFQENNTELEIKQAAGGGGIDTLREKTLESFTQAMQQFSKKGRVVIFLDTLERLLYHPGAETYEAGGEAESWDWLVKNVQDWGDVTLVIAGRPEAEGLARKADIKPIELPFLDESASLAYFKSIEAQAAKESDLYKRVQGLSDENRKKAHELAQGRPIILALIIDFLSVGDTGGEWRKVLEAQDTEEALEKTLMIYLTNLPSLGDTIRALGRAPKGAESKLLAFMLEIDESEAKKRLEAIKSFSFIKTSQKGERVFLHDQLYTMLNKWVLTGPHDYLTTYQVRKRIIAFIKAQLEEYKQQFAVLYDLKELKYSEEVERKNKDEDLPKRGVEELYKLKRNTLTEYIYYLLRHDPAKGFRQYYRYVCEAENATDVSMNVMLQAELASYLRENKSTLEKGGFTQEFAELVMEVQTILRLRGKEDKSTADQREKDFRTKYAETLSRSEYQCLEAVLQNHLAYKKINSASPQDLKTAEKLLEANLKILRKSIRSLQDVEKHEDVKIWYAGIALGYAYWLRGFLHRKRGEIKEAINNYDKAVKYFRAANLDIYLSGALNDKGFALCEDGNWQDGKYLVNEGLEKRIGLGALAPVGLSLNTLGIAERFEGSYEPALRYAEQALRWFKDAQFMSGQGLANIAIAGAHQRLGNEVPDRGGVSRMNKMNEYEQAISFSHAAVDIFQELGWKLDEAEAQKELGCAYRNQLMVLSTRGQKDIDHGSAAELIDRSKRALERMIELIENDEYRRLEGHLDLAYLGFAADDEKIYTNALKEVEAIIPSADDVNCLANEKAQQRKLYWTQSGKYHALLAQKAEKNEKNEMKKNSADAQKYFASSLEHYALALECNRKYALSYPGMSHAKDLVREKLQSFSINDLQNVRKIIERLENKYDLKNKSYLQEFLRCLSLWYDDDL